MALLAACAAPPPPVPVDSRAPTAGPTTRPTTLPTTPSARWVAVPWSDLPGWSEDRTVEAWPALVRGCERPVAGWEEACRVVRGAAVPDETTARAWMTTHLQPYRIEAHDGRADGLATGYFEPLVAASRQPRGAFRVPLYAAPADLAQRRPYWTRRDIDTRPEAQVSLRGREIAYVADPLDALSLQVQGSGRLQLVEPDGRTRLVRVAYAGHNDHPYQSIGRWLIDRGELRPGEASWPAIRAWVKRNPQRIDELLWANPRVVFFREEALPDPGAGPRGAQGVALTPGRSIAVDPQAIPYGTPVWIDTTEPLSSRSLRRLVMAQDTGSAIVGAVRADYFWGWGEVAEQQAGRMKQSLRLWALWPKGVTPR